MHEAELPMQNNCYQKANKYIVQIYLKTISIKKESFDNKPLIG